MTTEASTVPTGNVWTCAECGYGTVDPTDERDHNCDDEEVAIAMGWLHCVVCERWGTVPGLLRCQECDDEDDDSVPLSDSGRPRSYDQMSTERKHP